VTPRSENLDDILGQKNLFFFASVWVLFYAECTNEDVYLSAYDSKEEIYQRISNKKISRDLSWFDALMVIIQEDTPGVEFNYGISEVDIVLNSRNTQIFFLCNKVRRFLKELESLLKVADKEIKTKIYQDGSLVNLGSYFRSWLKYVNLVNPEFRMGGLDGQAFVLRELLQVPDLKGLADTWLRKVSRVLDLEGAKIQIPSSTQILSKIPSETTVLSAISVSLRVRRLVDLLHSHVSRGILQPLSESYDIISSLERAKDLLYTSYQEFSNNLETSINGISFKGTESEISFGKKISGFERLIDGLLESIEAVSRSSYQQDVVLREIETSNFLEFPEYIEGPVLEFLREREIVEKS